MSRTRTHAVVLWRVYKVTETEERQRRALVRGDEVDTTDADNRLQDYDGFIRAGFLEVGLYEAVFEGCTTDNFGQESCSEDSVYFTVTRDLRAVIEGDARQVGTDEAVIVSAAVSHPGAETRWIVYDKDGNKVGDIHNDDDIVTNDVLELLIPSKTLETGVYTIEFRATLPDGDSDVTRIELTVVEGSVPTAVIETVSTEDDIPVSLTDKVISYVPPDEALTITGRCSEGEPRWESSDLDLDDKDVVDGGRKSEVLVLREGVITRSVNEVNLVLTCTRTDKSDDEIVGSYQTTLVVNLPPEGGTCVINGGDDSDVRQLDNVIVSCADWIDPDSPSGGTGVLYYRFQHTIGLLGETRLTPFSVTSTRNSAPLVVPSPEDNKVKIIVTIYDAQGGATDFEISMKVKAFKGDCDEIVDVLERVLIPANQLREVAVVKNTVAVTVDILNAAKGEGGRKEKRCREKAREFAAEQLLLALQNQLRFDSTNFIGKSEAAGSVVIVTKLYGNLDELTDKVSMQPKPSRTRSQVSRAASPSSRAVARSLTLDATAHDLPLACRRPTTCSK